MRERFAQLLAQMKEHEVEANRLHEEILALIYKYADENYGFRVGRRIKHGKREGVITRVHTLFGNYKAKGLDPLGKDAFELYYKQYPKGNIGNVSGNCSFEFMEDF